jgi:hypothetical protein
MQGMQRTVQVQQAAPLAMPELSLLLQRPIDDSLG